MVRFRLSYVCLMTVATVQTVQLVSIKNLINNYIDLKMASMEMNEKATSNYLPREARVMNDLGERPYREIPVLLTGEKRIEYAKVSEEDYDRVTSLSKRWKLSTTGYPILVKRHPQTKRFETTYMHKFIHGQSAKHLNGDRLDNRKENLVSTTCKQNGNLTKEEKEKISMDADDFILFTPRVLCEDIHKFRWTEKELNEYSGYADIEYKNGKFFSGDVEKGKPHGYGHLFEGELNIQCCGEWKNGVMKNGMIITYKPYPKCLCDYMKHCPAQEVKNVGVVKNGYRI